MFASIPENCWKYTGRNDGGGFRLGQTMKRSFDEVNKIVGQLKAVDFYFYAFASIFPTNDMNHVKQLLASNKEAWRGEGSCKLSVCFVTYRLSNSDDGKILTRMSSELNDQFKQLGMECARNESSRDSITSNNKITEVEFGVHWDNFDKAMIEFFNRHNI